MTQIEVIQIDEDTRVTVHLDYDSDDPRTWGWDVELHEIDNYRIWRGWDHPHDPVAYAATQAHYNLRNGRWTREQRDRAIEVFLLLTGDDRQFRVHDYQGYAQSDWAVILEVGTQLGIYESYEQWRRGDVYILNHEKREKWVNETTGLGMTTWENYDSIGGVYLSDNYTYEDAAREIFGLTKKEGVVQ